MRKALACISAFTLTVAISGYVYLSVYAGRALHIIEFDRFASTVLWATVLHSDENGGARALQLAREVLSSNTSTTAIEADGQTYRLPLPPYTIRDEGGNRYLTFSSQEELHEFYKKDLPAAGWIYLDQMGAGHFFNGYGAHMVITEHFYLTSAISEINITITSNKEK
jgi:hypothetical protein